ncbi:glycosyltransferase family 4 protein [Lederbergia citri]|uniref:Undecaprenyl/decaprenyl-phosphate alpha-N-acetylglucosaminyl 1-phosphate transferase n=1 Tax=Lederbergia citri TaxID=2833580 RepID=A0A942YGP4_9BACI|nr:MraY family glycosyltransferase [Lederbergia citri]MBS4195722.1 undecaprenyl/decaprenyl-phosphate alpha-N-acetylglucosaminyl 1-phosphate transferase [Lederbergia citri]
MYTYIDYFIAFIISFAVSIIITPFVISMAEKYNFLDIPNGRKIHQSPIPRIGGLAIFIGTISGLLYLNQLVTMIIPIALGGIVIVITGLLDDKYSLKPQYKLIGQIFAACLVVFWGFNIEYINLPFWMDKISLGVFGYVIAIFWIVGITNAINLIDGLDGLATGVSLIALMTICILSMTSGQYLITALTLILIGSSLGFLIFNFHPAKIFLGDTGALFLGYSISTISILGLYKSITFFSLFLPIIILAFPLLDTIFAIIRRLYKGKKIFSPDKSHLHHRLMEIGLSHRATVIVIYVIATFSGLSAIIFSHSILWGALTIVAFILLFAQITAEIVGLVEKKPLLKIFRKTASNISNIINSMIP